MNHRDLSVNIESEPSLPAALLERLSRDSFLSHLSRSVYGTSDASFCAFQRDRLAETVSLHRARFGDRPTFLIRAPGRLNLFMEYLDMCRGSHLSTTTDGDIPMAFSPSELGFDLVQAQNADPLFPEGRFRIHEEIRKFLGASPRAASPGKGAAHWAALSLEQPYHGRKQGDWMNYLLAPYLRMAFEHPDVNFRGCDMTVGPSTIPIRAGTSSSSAMVVLSMLALLHCNKGPGLAPISPRKLCALLGESEWYVGTRGGANDQTTILRNRTNGLLLNLHYLDLLDSRTLPWLEGIGVILCNSLWEADKALGARHLFNLRKGWMDLARDLLLSAISSVKTHIQEKGDTAPGWLNSALKPLLPALIPPAEGSLLERGPEIWDQLASGFRHLGSLDVELLGLEEAQIHELISLLPEEVSPERVVRVLSLDERELQRRYTLPDPEEGGYRPRSAARFIYEEIRIGRELETLLHEASARIASRELLVSSPEYIRYQDRVTEAVNRVQAGLRDLFKVSNIQLDRLLAIAAKGPGFKAGKLTGAGSGGCVCLFVEAQKTEEMLKWLDREYFSKRENFLEYLQALDRLEASPHARHREKAEEMRGNLEKALCSPKQNRRIIKTFSQGAGPV